MRTPNEIEEQIEKIEQMLVNLEEQIHEVGVWSPLGIKMGKEYQILENDIKTLRWALS